jgi:hypothetical protein
MGSLTGVRVEIRTTSDGLVQYHNNQSGIKTYDVLKNHYNIVLKKGTATGTAENVNCTGNTCVLGPSAMTVKAPQNTSTQIKQDGSGTTVTSGSVGSGRSIVFNNIPIGLYDIVLTQGAGTVTVENVLHIGGTTVDMLHTLTVKAPQNTLVKVQTTGSGVLTSGSVGSGRSMILYVLRNDAWNLYLKQGAGETTIAMDNSAASTTVDRLTTLTVKAPQNTAAIVQTNDGLGNLTSGSVGSDRSMILYVLRNDGTDSTDPWRLSLTQGAGQVIVTNPELDASIATDTVDRLHTLTVKAPQNTLVKVQTTGSGVLTSGSVGSGRSMILYVLRNDGADTTPNWDLYLKQGAGEKTVSGIDTSAASSPQDQLCTLTANAPSGTMITVKLGTNVVAARTIGSSGSGIIYLVRNTYDVTDGMATKSVICTGATATVTFP